MPGETGMVTSNDDRRRATERWDAVGGGEDAALLPEVSSRGAAAAPSEPLGESEISFDLISREALRGENRFRMPMPGRESGSGDRVPDPDLIPTAPRNSSPGSRLPEPFRRLVDLREGLCEVCGKLCGFESVMPADPDAPELVKTRLCWLGWRLEDHLGTVALVVACSDRCAMKMADGTEGTEEREGGEEGFRSQVSAPDPILAGGRKPVDYEPSRGPR